MNRHFLLKQLHSNLKNNDTVDENNMVSNLSINNIILQTKIYIIGGVSSGGSYKFINDFKKFYTNSLQIKSNDILQSIKFNCNDILILLILILLNRKYLQIY